jgi:hypothetical protein
MGAQPYWYFTRYEKDVESALDKLRRREFEAGRYNPVMPFIEFPIDPAAESPGAQHLSIQHARDAADMDGTRSILDIEEIGDMIQIGVAAPLDDESLEDLYETAQPTHEMIEANMDFFEKIDRGEAIYIVVYKDGKPDELFFAGYSFD